MKKTWATLALTALLAACGGGGDETVTTVSPPAPQPVVVADATLTQFATSPVVTPGAMFQPALASTTCVVDAKTGICAKQVPLGELGITTSLKLTDVKFWFDGQLMNGVSITEEGKYRFFPVGYYTVWKPGIAVEVTATLAPSTTSGTTATVALQAASASFDKTLDVAAEIGNKVTVFAQANYAPARITVLGNQVSPSFQYSCPTTVSNSCWLQFTAYVGGAPDMEVRLYQDDLWIFQGWTDGNGYLSVGMGTGIVYAGQRITYRAEALGSLKSVWFRDFLSNSGGKQIEPLKPEGCTIVTPEGCKD